ncbi:hypothetical protein TNIN_221481 [Trichonephila inaurata madagascariensis]|uniref:Uncharacterized protein n=1 Tax=Trichonephila inaurata madagascariensis TaxID=2747483 RepID=A0A8X7CCE9_9ARAC|nr:hypothetical protein TNIN_221481 [Trichonephila inaurata madagascariensis]
MNLAEMADKIISVYNPTDISIVNKQDHSQAVSCSWEDNSRLSSIEANIGSLTQKIHKLYAPNYNKPRYRNRSRSHPTSRNPTNRLCWYHYRSGAKAQKCISPCSFKELKVNQEN